MEEAMTLREAAGQLFPLLFNMMGPIGLIPVFVRLTADMDQKSRIAMARRATGLAFVALFLAVFLGAIMLDAWSIGNGSLIFAAGLIVTSTALLPIVWSGSGGAPNGSAMGRQTPEQLAVSPLAFPGIVTPRAVSVLIIFVGFFPSTEGKLTVVAVAGLMLLLNLLGMRYAHWFMDKIGMTPLLVLGAVFGVLQVALGVEMISQGLTLWTQP